MGKLTSKQVNELANNFLALAQSIGDYRYKNYDSLTKAQNKKLRESHKRTLDYSDDLYTLSATLVMDEAKSSLSKLNTGIRNKPYCKAESLTLLFPSGESEMHLQSDYYKPSISLIVSKPNSECNIIQFVNKIVLNYLMMKN